MHVTALVGARREDLVDRRLQPGIVIGDDELDPMQTALAQAHEKIPPARSGLAVGQLDPEHLAAAVPINADGDQHRLPGPASRTRS